MRDLALAPLADDHTDALRALSVHDWQKVFSGQPAEHLDNPGDLDTHVILRSDHVVGMFRIDPRYHLTHTFAQSNTPGLRSFIVDRDRQGSGIGRAACRLLPGYVREHYPRSAALYLTVNQRNAGAYKAYTLGGFTDTGAEYLLGHAGPQHILRMPLL